MAKVEKSILDINEKSGSQEERQSVFLHLIIIYIAQFTVSCNSRFSVPVHLRFVYLTCFSKKNEKCLVGSKI